MKYQLSKSALYYFVVTVIFIQLLGCGGGGGDAVPITPPAPVVTDTTPPVVTQAIPLDYAFDVPLDTQIAVSFDELMKSSTVSSSSFIVKDAMDNIVPGVITESNTTYIFTPDSVLKFDTSYNVTITTSVTDLADNNLDFTYSWVFYTVKVPHPTAPASLDASNLTDTSVTLNGLFTNPLNDTTTAWFEYGLTDSYGSQTPAIVYSAVATIDHSSDLINLPEKATYHYRIATQNTDGIFYGDDKTFRTYITPEILVSDLDGPGYYSLNLHNSELYWAEIYSNVVRKIPVTGGAATIEATSTMAGNAVSLDMDMTHLYWGDNYKVWMKPIGIGSGTLIASSLPVVHGFKIYLTDLYVLHNSNISKIDISSGILTTVITKDQYTITSYDVDASGIYWNNSIDGTISKSNHDGASEVTLAVGLNKPNSLLLDAGKIYWAESNAIKSINTTGGEVTTIATNVSPSRLAKDSTHIYFVDELSYPYHGYNISSVNVATGEITILTQVNEAAISIVVDDTHVYWLTYGNHWYPPLGQVIKSDKSY